MAHFLHQIKRTNGKFEKGIVVKESGATDKENYDAALQGYHAYLGAYAYGHDATTDYVAAEVQDMEGNRLIWEVWKAPDTEPEPEPTTEPEGE